MLDCLLNLLLLKIIKKLSEPYKFLKSNSPICFSTYAASSEVALGIIPGSDRLVLSKEDMVNKNKNTPTMGIAIVTFSAKYLQLKKT